MAAEQARQSMRRRRFRREAAAAAFLLRDSTRMLTVARVRFVVVGGWVPWFFHSRRYGHPGTYDVDLLIHPDSLDDGTFDAASEALLSAGYLRAVKNKFQAHRILRVGNEDLVFHVDFLNERDPGESVQLVTGRGRLQSI